MGAIPIEPSRTSGGGGGGGTIGGSIATNQVAVGSGVNTISGSSNFLFNGITFVFNGAIVLPKQTSTGINYNVLASDCYIRCVTSPASAITITMPLLANVSTGQVFMIKDATRAAGVGTELTISASGGELIDGSVSQVYTTPGVCIWLRSAGTAWEII